MGWTTLSTFFAILNPDHSPPQSPISARTWSLPSVGLNFPSLDLPSSQKERTEAELLISTSPVAGAAINRIVAACGQMNETVRDPFLSLSSLFPLSSVNTNAPCASTTSLHPSVSSKRCTQSRSSAKLVRAGYMYVK
jgi:hypothetical protein